MQGLAYVIARFPLVSETFILREILELQRIGWDVPVYAIRPGNRQVRHPEVSTLEASIRMMRPGSAAMLHANARSLVRDPRQFAGLGAAIVRGNWRSPDFLAKGLSVFPWIVELVEEMRRQRVRHIHAHYGTHPALIAMLVARVLGIGFSFTAHAHDMFVNATMLAEKVRAARFVVAISEFNRAALCRLAGSDAASKIKVVRCGIDTDRYAFRGEKPLAHERRILAVGSLQEYKGLDRLIRACALLRSVAPKQPFRCDIVGAGPLLGKLQAQIASEGLANEVTLLGARDQHAVRDMMECADALVLPSVIAPDGQMEGLPVTLMEAMAVGTPVIASHLSGIPELVQHGVTGLLVPPDDPAAIRDAILNCWGDPSAAVERSRRGRDLVHAQHNLRNNVAELSALFSEYSRTISRSDQSFPR